MTKLSDEQVKEIGTFKDKFHYFCGQMLPWHWQIFVKEEDVLTPGMEIGYAPAYAKTPEGFLYWIDGQVVIKSTHGLR